MSEGNLTRTSLKVFLASALSIGAATYARAAFSFSDTPSEAFKPFNGSYHPRANTISLDSSEQGSDQRITDQPKSEL